MCVDGYDVECVSGCGCDCIVFGLCGIGFL